MARAREPQKDCRSPYAHRIAGRVARLLCLVALLGHATRIHAQYRAEIWTADTGLPQNIVRGLGQTPDKYLWIATLDGLARFDGVHFTVFSKGNTPGIVSNRFEGLNEGQNGDLWLTTEGGRVTRYHRGVFATYGPAQGLPDEPVRAACGDSAGEVWFLFDSKIVKWNERAQKFEPFQAAKAGIAYRGARWGSGAFWGVEANRLHLFANGNYRSYSLPSWVPAESIWGIGMDGTATIWIETQDGQYASLPVDGSREATPLQKAPTLSYKDRNGEEWTIRVGRRLSRTVEFSTSGGLQSVPIVQMYEDDQGSMWLGTDGRGVYQLRKQFIHTISKEQGLVDRNVYPIYRDSSGAIFVGAWNSGLSRVKDGKFENFTTANGLPNGLVSALAEDSAGRMLIATHGGIVRYEKGKLVPESKPNVPRDAVVQVMRTGRDGTMWYGSSQGLLSVRGGMEKLMTKRDGLATDDVRAILESGDGAIWVAGYGGLTRIQGKQLQTWTERDGLPSDNLRSLYEDADGVLWIGTYDNGLARLEKGRLTRYGTRDGLYDPGVFQILEDGRGNLWMSCNRGIYRVSKRELNQFASGLLTQITSVGYGKIDGMLNTECNGGLAPAGMKTPDGKLWFPTQDGIAVIDPEGVPVNTEPPEVLIESTMVDRVPGRGVISIVIPAHRENLEIRYTAVTFVNAAQTRFKYRMEGLDTAWNEAGTRRVAYYGHIPPGKYTFRVIAGNSDGVWNTEGASLQVVALAPFYRTGWFFAAMTMLALGVLAMAWSYRLKQLKREQALQHAFSQQLIASQESERKRIAADLHDSIGQRLIVINNLALMMLRGADAAKQTPKENETLKEINSEASQAIEEARGISYNLRPFQLDRLGLNKAIEAVIRSVATASGMHISSELDDINDLFSEDLRINFYRIVQESLNNIMKHAQATEVAIRLRRTDSLLTLRIEDNGKGIKPAGRPAATSRSGFGLTGMAERARLLGGSFEIRPGPEKGTIMTVEIPLGAATRGRED